MSDYYRTIKRIEKKKNIVNINLNFDALAAFAGKPETIEEHEEDD